MVLHSLAEAARLDVTVLLAAMKAVFFGSFMWCNTLHRQPSTLSPEQLKILDSIPRDVRTLFTQLDLEPPDTVRHAVCPKCRATYAPNKRKSHDPYPHRCTFRETDKEVCGEKLAVKRETIEGKDIIVTYEPLQWFPYRPFKSWITELFQRPELATLARQAWNTVPGGKWNDIWDAPALRELRGPDGRTLFSEQPEGAVHLVFSLFVDWFNPYGNKQAGKSHSIGAIYLVCLNLPPDIRYRPENVYLAGVIPGPNEPETHQMNHFLRPLIDDLLDAWYRGIYLSSCAFEGGSSLFVRAAIVPLVCDLPALRKVGGFASHSAAHFCSFCQLLKSKQNDLDRDSWPRRDNKQHRKLAEQWKNLGSEAERTNHFEQHGLRWSELLRLRYWDPTRFALVDAMHNLFLGELHHHCRHVWGIDVKDKGSGAKTRPHTPKEQLEWLQHVVKYVKLDSFNKLKLARKGYLVAVAELNGAVIPAARTFAKRDYIVALLKWVRSVPVALCHHPHAANVNSGRRTAAKSHCLRSFPSQRRISISSSMSSTYRNSGFSIKRPSPRSVVILWTHTYPPGCSAPRRTSGACRMVS